MDGTILSQGSFIVPATIVPVNLVVPSGVDWIKVTNFTRQGTVGGAAAFPFEYSWQRGMAAGTALVKYYANAGAVVTGDQLVSGGFTLYDASNLPIGASVAYTAISNATRPVVNIAATAGIAVGSVVRLSLLTGDTAVASAVSGIDFVVGALVANTSITLGTASSALANTVGIVTGTGHYRVVNTDGLFYPKRRFISNITQAVNAVVSTTVAHGYVAGQAVRFSIPAVSGMIQLNPSVANSSLSATVVAVVDAYNFSINVDTTAFSAFSFPTVAQQPSSYPEVHPLGENTAAALASANAQLPIDSSGNPIYNANSGILSDSLVNTGFLGMTLGVGGVGNIAGAVALTGPAGSVAADVVYWQVGKSTFGGL